MKFRLFLFTAAMLAFAYSSPAAFAGDDKKNQSSDQTAAPASKSVEPSATKVAHNGGIEDLDAIGNRNVGCSKGMGNWYGLEKQIALGKQVSQEVETQSKMIN